MDKLKTLIIENEKKFPEFMDIINIITILQSKDSTNDAKIDCSKAIIEAIAKNILINLEPSINPKKIEKNTKFINLSKRAIQKISNQKEDMETRFIDNLHMPLICLVSTRDDNGDVSHGHVGPKNNSTDEFTELILNYSEAIALYLLRNFYSLDGSFQRIIYYEENPDFNDFLDSIYPLEGKPLYSLALYDQYYEDYQIQLEDYQYQQDMEEE